MEGAMQIEENGQGTLRNNLSGKLAYYSFFPTPLQSLRQLNLTEETYRTLSACSRKLGELEGMLYFVPNADMYLTMYVRKEALLLRKLREPSARLTTYLVHRKHNSIIKMSQSRELRPCCRPRRRTAQKDALVHETS